MHSISKRILIVCYGLLVALMLKNLEHGYFHIAVGEGKATNTLCSYTAWARPRPILCTKLTSFLDLMKTDTRDHIIYPISSMSKPLPSHPLKMMCKWHHKHNAIVNHHTQKNCSRASEKILTYRKHFRLLE